MTDRVVTLLADLDRIAEVDREEQEGCLRRATWLRHATTDEVQLLLQDCLDRRPPSLPIEDRLLETALYQLILGLLERAPVGQPTPLDDATLAQVAEVYRHLGRDSRARNGLLQLLTSNRTPVALAAFADLVADDPPRDAKVVAAAFGPLFRYRDYAPSALFPRLLDGLSDLTVASVALDLSNFVTREQLVDAHPALEKGPELTALLDGLTDRLAQMEITPPADSESATSISEKINESVPLVVALCDALAWIGEQSSVDGLKRAMRLRHRRIQAEAAAALIRLGSEEAAAHFVQLAAEPIVRLRVVAYAQELGLLERIDPQYKTDQALAESELALWLAQPSQMGIPPTRCELFDKRTQYWPGYDQPVACFLFRFVYQLGDQEFTNLGIAGPVTYAFGPDLSDLSPDDIYAAFAGWCAEHDEISESDWDSLDEPRQRSVQYLQRHMLDSGCEAISPVRLGSFFGDNVLVANATQAGNAGIAIADQQQVAWFPRMANRRPLGPDEAYCIYKGRKLLKAFNG